MTKKPNLRKCIDENCIACGYDPGAAGTWRQQVTLCSIKGNCALYPVRPVSKAPIPESVLDYYQVTGAERAVYSLSRPLEGPVTEANESEECGSEGPLNTPLEKLPIRGGAR
jgi:hypothetical protein